MVERLICNQDVVSSNLTGGTTNEEEFRMRGIAYRRHTVLREKARALRKLKARWKWTPPEGRPTSHVEAQVGILAQTRAPCSCAVCGNPRRHFGELLMSERRALSGYLSHIHEIQFGPDEAAETLMEKTC
jgi:hypothetical protein